MTIQEQLRRDEGARHRAYQDSLGVWTVGIGHNLAVPLTDEAVEQIFADDLARVEAECLTLPVWVDLSPTRQGVLLNMCFNLGLHGLLGFHRFFAALEARQYRVAATEMLDSLWAEEVGLRAERLARQMETDEWV